jgi:UDP-N-acetylglucosamine 2-epimerase
MERHGEAFLASMPRAAPSDQDRVIVVAGIRSQFIKLAAFQRGVAEWKKLGQSIPELIYINSGQHYDDQLARQYLDELSIQIDIDLTGAYDVGDPTRVTAEMFVALHEEFEALRSKYRVHFGIVFGDANTTLAAAVALRKAGIHVVHIEAGVRTGDALSSEEINRIVADSLACLHFASCKRDHDHLCAEGRCASTVLVGDIVYDLVSALASNDGRRENPTAGSGVSLVTLHRAENTADVGVLAAILEVLAARRERVILVSHPRTVPLLRDSKWSTPGSVSVRQSMPYREFLAVLRDARYVITDSGAVQREAYYLGNRCLVRQDSAFWQTFIDAGVHRKIAGTAAAVAEGCDWLEESRALPYPVVNDFGNGHAMEAILRELERQRWLAPSPDRG